MKLLQICLLPCLTALPVLLPAKDFDVPERHRPIETSGRDFWRILAKYGDFGIWSSARRVRFDNPKILELPAFSDVVPAYFGRREPPSFETGFATWRSFADNFTATERDREILTSNPQPDRPFVMQTTRKRDFTCLGGRIDLDAAEYRAWRTAHPNLLYDGSLGEWDNDLWLAFQRLPKLKDETRRAEIAAFLGAFPNDRDVRLAKMRQIYARSSELFYGGKMRVLSSHVFSQFLACDLGATMIGTEMTNTSGSPTDDTEYRWNLAPIFARGASRQFGCPWEWYVAGYMNGFASDGTWWNNSVCVYPDRPDAPDLRADHQGPDFGTSVSLLRRACYYAYVNGANFLDVEEWSAQLLKWSPEKGKTVLSPRARDYIDFADFTRRHPDRGTTYTPVAVCVPFNQGYPAYGGWAWAEPACGYTERDHRLDAFFFTLVPGFERAKAMKAGIETNLHNSPYAHMYDVICLDAPSQSAAEKRAVMNSYKALVVFGDGSSESEKTSLAEYAARGGRIVRIGSDAVPPPQRNAVAELRAGRETFAEIAKTIADLQDAYFPFVVEGDVLYGANRTKSGWWLWVLNNRGVIKFADQPQKVDKACAAMVRVRGNGIKFSSIRELVRGESVSVTSGQFRAVVPAGDLSVFEVSE